ncbi:hypothetical protein BRADI_3g18758v3 [Brachypodium distachyon]|uniref:Secreted protein n=1 Tax=Brachypodium distachyon TaxID=15368 RepID=A0A2K2CY39_BRADI|nr:hypothetical protein BRADI_3g18758v3 [Brachypodium distachyon]
MRLVRAHRAAVIALWAKAGASVADPVWLGISWYAIVPTRATASLASSSSSRAADRCMQPCHERLPRRAAHSNSHHSSHRPASGAARATTRKTAKKALKPKSFSFVCLRNKQRSASCSRSVSCAQSSGSPSSRRCTGSSARCSRPEHSNGRESVRSTRASSAVAAARRHGPHARSRLQDSPTRVL